MLLTLWDLFFSFLKVGMFSFGGAYSLLPVIEKEVVQNNQWLTHDEFMQTLSIVEFVPGAISIKFATFTGYKTAGVLGAIAANLGNLLFPALLMVALYHLLFHIGKNQKLINAFNSIKFAIIGMIIVIMLKYLFKGSFEPKFMIFLVLGAVMAIFNVHPAIIVVCVGLLSLVI